MIEGWDDDDIEFEVRGSKLRLISTYLPTSDVFLSLETRSGKEIENRSQPKPQFKDGIPKYFSLQEYPKPKPRPPLVVVPKTRACAKCRRIKRLRYFRLNGNEIPDCIVCTKNAAATARKALEKREKALRKEQQRQQDIRDYKKWQQQRRIEQRNWEAHVKQLEREKRIAKERRQQFRINERERKRIESLLASARRKEFETPRIG